MLSVTPPGLTKSRRLDLHQHDSAYKADAFLCRATSASRGIRRELNPYLLLHRQACLPRTPRTPYCSSGKGGSRTITFLVVTQATLPLDHGIVVQPISRAAAFGSVWSREEHSARKHIKKLVEDLVGGWLLRVPLRLLIRRMSLAARTNAVRRYPESNPRCQVEGLNILPIEERAIDQVDCEGIEPLVAHLACFVTTALQAAARSTTR